MKTIQKKSFIFNIRFDCRVNEFRQNIPTSIYWIISLFAKWIHVEKILQQLNGKSKPTGHFDLFKYESYEFHVDIWNFVYNNFIFNAHLIKILFINSILSRRDVCIACKYANKYWPFNNINMKKEHKYACIHWNEHACLLWI